LYAPGVMTCPVCGGVNADGKRFCGDCGAGLSVVCPSCSSLVEPGRAFCGDCGQSLTATSPVPGQLPAATTVPVGGRPVGVVVPVVERRVCSVLFGDLVGFTSISEGRDVEVVRELLSRYFEAARTVVERYGGAVEKFIGDAVMAVWGSSVARDDDAERAVRAGLELVDAVAALGDSQNVDALAARVGVVTAEVAVTVGAAGEGMVAGDPVNTAARFQTAADPGVVLVDERTRSLTRDAVAYVESGGLSLKGKSLEVAAWRAVRVVAGIGGEDRIDGLTTAMLGRDRELRMVKELFHATVDGGGARLVAVSGAAGSGKSRLGVEFENYVDGLATEVLWHRGHCLSYGNGVAFWALAEMVRARCGIAEDEEAESAGLKLTATLERYIPDLGEREYVAPRVGALLGLAEPGLDKTELYAGWRLFLERLSEVSPVVLVIEDAQHADADLLDFLDLVLDWSAAHRIFILTLARPDLEERRAGWGTGRSISTPVMLAPLPDPVMSRLLDGLVEGLTPALRTRIIGLAAGMPLFAVETIRSLIDRDLVVPDGGVYRVAPDAGPVEDLAVPATLTALIAARIDALPEPERRLLHGLAVLGGSFPQAAVSAVTDTAGGELEGLLASLLRKEILSVRGDRLSPERGRYAFTQPLLRQVAYDTMSHRDRGRLHRHVADHLRAAFPDDGAEVAEVIAAHYHDALTLTTDPTDRDRLRDQALSFYIRAGDRALTVGAPARAVTVYQGAATLTDDDEQQATLTGRAGMAAYQAGDPIAVELLDHAITTHQKADRHHHAATLMGALGNSLADAGRLREAIERIADLLAVIDDGTLDPDVCRLTGILARHRSFAGDLDTAAQELDRAFRDAQALDLPDVLTRGFDTRAIIQLAQDRTIEAVMSIEAAVSIAHQHGLTREEMIAHTNAEDILSNAQLPGADTHAAAALDLARLTGDRATEALLLANADTRLLNAGRWDEINPPGDDTENVMLADMMYRAHAHIAAARGEDPQPYLEPLLHRLDSDDPTIAAAIRHDLASVALQQGRLRDALTDALLAYERGLAAWGFGVASSALVTAIEAAIRLGELDEAERLLALITDRPPGHVQPSVRAAAAHQRARANAARGRHDECDADFQYAEAILDELGYAYDLADARHWHATWLADHHRNDEAIDLATQAADTYTRLRAAPALTRTRELLDRLTPSTTTPERTSTLA
jgi:class 3 adenylate cyclase/tetratricopeptide (TPR) repeat protein